MTRPMYGTYRSGSGLGGMMGDTVRGYGHGDPIDTGDVDGDGFGDGDAYGDAMGQGEGVGEDICAVTTHATPRWGEP